MPASAQLRGRQFLLASTVLITLVGGFSFATLRRGHVWGDDFAMYVQHARNIAEGRPFAESGYIYNPSYPQLGPPSYPPVYPLLLAPVYKIAGLNWKVLKTVGVICLLGALAMLPFLFGRDLGPKSVLALIAVLGLNPFFQQFKDQIVSDFPFLLFVLVALLLLQRAHDRSSWALDVVAGLSICVCVATRAVGVVLLPSFLLYEWLSTRRITRTAVRVCATALISVFLYLIKFRGSTSYGDQLHVTLFSISHNLYFQSWQIYRYLWGNGLSSGLALFVTALLGLLGLAGYVLRLRYGWNLFEVFVPLYLTMIILWPTEDDLRFLIPVIPFWLFYAALAIEWMSKNWSSPLARALGPSVLGLIVLSYAGAYTHYDFGPITEGVGDPQFHEVCIFISQRTPPTAVFIFEKPRLLSLLTARKASGYGDVESPDQLWAYGQHIGVEYWLDSNTSRRDVTYLKPMLDQYRPQLEVVFSNSGFEIYRATAGEH